MPLSYVLFHSYRALERGGDSAIADFRAALGARARVALATSRVTEPLAENAGKIAVAAALSAAVIGGGLIAGAQLRKRRMRHAQEPYRFPWPGETEMSTGTDDAEPIGI